MSSAGWLMEVLSGQYIRAVYQPIVSLKNGKVLGYEALSRLALPACTMNIRELFEAAGKAGKLWELEKLCRTRALQSIYGKPSGTKIFLNVDPNVICDPAFTDGFTRAKLSELGLNLDDIIFEITERSSAGIAPSFAEVVGHYQQEHFKVAIDNFGAGYSGLTMTGSLSPEYFKIDMSIIRGIDRSSRKRSVLLGIMRFCQEEGIGVIATGIETREELAAIMQMGVEYGQGYLLGHPEKEFRDPDPEGILLIKEFRKNGGNTDFSPSIFGTVGAICQRKPAVKPTERALPIYEKMRADPSMTEVCVVDKENRVCGILTRNYLVGRFSGQFGYSLCYRRSVRELLSQDYMVVDRGDTVDAVAALAMERDFGSVYDAVIVTGQGRYLGVVTVRDLLTAAISIREKNAADANPLTGLPGNNAIQSVIGSVIQSRELYAIVYLDLDNFKAYNDAYGFTNGDGMIKALSQAILLCCRPEDFKGHIGGDDFVVVTRNTDHLSTLCEKIITTFSGLIEPLYTPADWERGYIISNDRNGFLEQFPIATLSIAAVTSRSGPFSNMAALSKAIAEAKKRCKQQKGNAVVIA